MKRYLVIAAPVMEDRYTKITSPFLFKMKSTLQQIYLTADRRLIKEVLLSLGK
jgi:hypothetical protein